ncbi:ABC transporter ATP-binding protein [Candidatus Saccharibacteria bacterium]|nr:ABC transporter ATP-binding protein [Candidatus Saccharibacteria bacterium]
MTAHEHGILTRLDANDITKDFGNGRGIFDVNLTVHKGEIVGFVGPNGAGKSTTINILTGFINPDRGHFAVLGEMADTGSIHHLMSRIGILLSEPTIEPDLTAAQVFRRSQELLGLDCSQNWRRMSQELELDVDKKVKKLSLGNKKKVGIINALMHEPDLLIMDEPTSGLDPLIRSRFMAMVKQMADNGGAVLLSSHDLGEVQAICDRIVMIKAGRVILSDTTDHILDKAERAFRLLAPPKELLAAIRKLKIRVTEEAGSEAVIHTAHYKEMIELLTRHKFYNFYIERPTLEETFKENYR